MSDSNPPPTDALTAATQMVKNGRLDLARDTLMQYLIKNPNSEQAWLLMSYVLPDPAKQKDCLERVLKINPNNTVAQSKLAHLLGRRTEELFKRKPEPPPPAASKPEPEPIPVPEPEIEPEPAPAAVPETLHAIEKPTFASAPAPKPGPKPGPSFESVIPPEPIPSKEQGSTSPGKWFRIITIILVVVVMILAATIFYIGVLGPAIHSLSITPTPTALPVKTVEFPTQWTQTLTPTETPTPLPSETPALAPSNTPTEITIS
jgi:hypothetical protein